VPAGRGRDDEHRIVEYVGHVVEVGHIVIISCGVLSVR
jgi:hypothetical protein